MAKKSLGQILLVVILGAMVGTLFGELLTLLLPTGVVKEFFLKTAHFGFGPSKLDVTLFTITVGFTIKLNIVGLIGIAVAIYLLRWY
ncbi:DUF4321 domain-containing protein [candidate division KSB1 bacterium]|nr:DUF4321 domain-containing protein [candidate division KSB1 bacterium]NIR70145.1 DUF4321 domain-containing protein [candidate division KSB1 bacterium]NIS28057.1 DUF4321 domain-containing protein [candidate division KSB1 bacterium]NIT74926.1 DUF4321 domain-containing protein [candidate division KSB1 bacterium]NIU28710.1 DUF4321 domain-containing protein [candidate division KSB1 bacterium]